MGENEDIRATVTFELDEDESSILQAAGVDMNDPELWKIVKGALMFWACCRVDQLRTATGR